MGGTSTISGGKLCLRIDPRVPTLSGCAASRGPTIKANTVPFSWIMASIHEGLVKDWQRTRLAGYISTSLQIMRLSCSERRLAPLDSWIGQSGLRSLEDRPIRHRRQDQGAAGAHLRVRLRRDDRTNRNGRRAIDASRTTNPQRLMPALSAPA